MRSLTLRLVMMAIIVVVATATDARLGSEAVAPASEPKSVEECGTTLPSSDAHELAFELLTEESDLPLLDNDRLTELSAELDVVLQAVRRTNPGIAHIGPRLVYAPGDVIVTFELESPLAASVLNALGDDGVADDLTTGNDTFDNLSAQFCLVEARDLFFPVVLLALDDLTNVPLAVTSYSDVEGVAHAEPNYTLGDGPDIAVTEQNDTWFVVVRDARGLCPSGCTEQTLYYFVVVDGQATEVCENDAWVIPTFLALAQTWGAQRLPDHPATCMTLTPPLEQPISLPATGGQP